MTGCARCFESRPAPVGAENGVLLRVRYCGLTLTSWAKRR
jgi:hypothetical protein